MLESDLEDVGAESNVIGAGTFQLPRQLVLNQIRSESENSRLFYSVLKLEIYNFLQLTSP
jgi:hypothetical protein